MNYKLYTALIAILLMAGCATAKQPPPPPPVIFPIGLVNYAPRVVVVQQEAPSTQKLSKIRAEDPADAALVKTLVYLAALKSYSQAVTAQASQCQVESDDAHDKLDKIKQYILLRQGSPTQ